MTNKDRKLIADYMGWDEDSFFKGYRTLNGHAINFDLNDARLVVQEMQKRGEWDEFITYMEPNTNSTDAWSRVIAWLMTMEDGVAKNFFSAFVEWRKGK